MFEAGKSGNPQIINGGRPLRILAVTLLMVMLRKIAGVRNRVRGW